MKLSDIFLYLGVALLLLSCTRGTVPFNEAQWRKQVENQSVEKLYAVHFGLKEYVASLIFRSVRLKTVCAR